MTNAGGLLGRGPGGGYVRILAPVWLARALGGELRLVSQRLRSVILAPVTWQAVERVRLSWTPMAMTRPAMTGLAKGKTRADKGLEGRAARMRMIQIMGGNAHEWNHGSVGVCGNLGRVIPHPKFTPPLGIRAPWVIIGWSENSWSQSDTDPWEACAKVGGKGSGSPNLLTQPMCTPPNGRTA